VEGIEAFAAALGLVAFLELGDKTQLVTISLAARHPWAQVFAGASLGLLATTAIGAAIGGAVGSILGSWLFAIKIVGAAVFLAIGAWSVVALVRAEEGPGVVRERRTPFLTALGFAFLAEFGDKTQLAVIVLAATSEAPLSTFLGAGLGLVVIACLSVLLGTGLARLVSGRRLRAVSATLFLVAGVVLLVDSLAGR